MYGNNDGYAEASAGTRTELCFGFSLIPYSLFFNFFLNNSYGEARGNLFLPRPLQLALTV